MSKFVTAYKSSVNRLNGNLKKLVLERLPSGCVAFDVETTGLSPLVDRLVELAAFRLCADGTLQEFGTLIDPGIPIPARATDIHGITDAMVHGAPSAEAVLGSFVDFVADLPLVAHNAGFDCGFLLVALHRASLPRPPLDVYCSLRAARLTFKDMPDKKLSTLARHLGIDLANHHRAGDDALASLAVFGESLGRGSGDVLGRSLLFNTRDFRRQALSIPKVLLPLAEKAARREIVDIHYLGGSRRDIFRPVEPLGLLPLPKGSALYAKCLLDGDYKYFLLRKIADFRSLTEGQRLQRTEGVAR